MIASGRGAGSLGFGWSTRGGEAGRPGRLLADLRRVSPRRHVWFGIRQCIAGLRLDGQGWVSADSL